MAQPTSKSHIPPSHRHLTPRRTQVTTTSPPSRDDIHGSSPSAFPNFATVTTAQQHINQEKMSLFGNFDVAKLASQLGGFTIPDDPEIQHEYGEPLHITPAGSF